MDKNNYHLTNAIYAKIKSALEAMLVDLGCSGWQVVRSNQPTIQALQGDTIYFDVISRRRYGTQGTIPVKVDGVWTVESTWYEELLVQVSGFKRKSPQTDSVETLSSSDVVGLLQGLVNANGDIKYFSESWLDVIRSSDLREIVFQTDSGLNDKFPMFEFVLVVEQRVLKNIGKIDTIELETKRI